MKRHVICLLVAGFVGAVAVTPTFGQDELKMKLEAMRKQLDDLNAKEKDLAKQRADLQKAIADLQREANRKAEEDRVKREIEQKKFDEADRKKHYVKIELRGKLIHSKSAQPQVVPETFSVLTNDATWPLSFGDKKELLQTANKLIGKPVIVTGSLSTVKRFNPMIYPFPDESFPGIPMPKPGDNPRLPRWPPNTSPYIWWPETPGPVVVESIKLVEEK